MAAGGREEKDNAEKDNEQEKDNEENPWAALLEPVQTAEPSPEHSLSPAFDQLHKEDKGDCEEDNVIAGMEFMPVEATAMDV